MFAFWVTMEIEFHSFQGGPFWSGLQFVVYVFYLTSVSLAEKAKCFIARTSNRVLRFQMKQDRLHYIFRAFTL